MYVIIPVLAVAITLLVIQLLSRNTLQRIAYRYAGMGVGRRIDDDPVNMADGVADPVRQHALVIALHEIQFHAKLTGDITEPGFDLRQRHRSVKLGLPAP